MKLTATSNAIVLAILAPTAAIFATAHGTPEKRAFPGHLQANIALLRERRQQQGNDPSQASAAGHLRRSVRDLAGCGSSSKCICDEAGLRKAIDRGQLTASLLEDESADFQFFCDGATIEISKPINVSGKSFELAADYSAFGRPKPGVTLKPKSGSKHQLFVGGPDSFYFGVFGAIIDGFSGENGGAVSLKGGTAYFTGCEFTNNEATGHGGAIYVAEGAYAMSEYTNYNGNKAGRKGQEVYVDTRTDEKEPCPTPSPTNSPQPTIHYTLYPTIKYDFPTYPTMAPVPTISPYPTYDWSTDDDYYNNGLCYYTSFSCYDDKYCGDHPKDAFAQAVNVTTYGNLNSCTTETSSKNTTDNSCVPVNSYYYYPF